jgi:hypothetical protein
MRRFGAGAVGGLMVASVLAASGGAATQTVTRGSPGATVDFVRFVPAAPIVRQACQQTADAVGYAVPCPTLLPVGIEPTPGYHGCHFYFVAAMGVPGCGGAVWRGWFFGSIMVDSAYTAGFQHLVVQGMPSVVGNPVQAIDGPGRLIRGAGVKPLGAVNVQGMTMRWYFVPPNLNEGSAFQQHLVLVWTTAGHTYAYGFHVVDTIADARALDLELVRHLVSVKPLRAR